MAGRPDFSEYVAHFTSSKPVLDRNDLTALTSRQRLAQILSDRRVRATKMPWTYARAAAFTECPWASLPAHAQRYSRYAIGFSKQFLVEKGGGPAIYLRTDLYSAQVDHVKGLVQDSQDPKPFAFAIWPFITPLAYQPWKTTRGEEKDPVDFTHEREWRVPGGLPFEYGNIEFVIVDELSDLKHLPSEALDAIGPERIFSIAQYERIEEMWPVHR